MQANEIKELYAQKTGAPPGPGVSKFIDNLKVREVAKIWSAMGEGEDFVGALKRIIGDQIKKAGGAIDLDSMDLDANLAKLEELKKKAEEEAKERAIEKQREKERLLEEKKKREAEEKLQAEKEAKEKKEAEEERRRQEERAEREKKEAAAKEEAARKAEEEAKQAQEAAAKAMEAAEAAAREREKADQLEQEAAQKRMAEAQRIKEEAERTEREAKARAEAEKAAAEAAKERAKALTDAQEMMQEVLAQQERERQEQERLREQRREEEERKLKEADEEIKKAEGGHEEEEEEEDTAKHEEELAFPVTITLNSKDEQLGIHGLLATGDKVRAIDLIPNGACARAGVKAASVIREVNGTPITAKEHLLEALKAIRSEEQLSFQMIVEPPLSKEELEQDMEKVKEERKRRAKAQVMEAMKTAHQLIVDLCVVGAHNLIAGGSKNIFCEIKLRTVSDGKVGSDHPNPQKSATKTVKGTLSPAFDHKVRMVVPPTDAIRISIFGAKTIGKEYKGRVDLILPEVVPNLNCGGKAIVTSYTIVGDEGRGTVSGHLDVAMRVKGFVKDDPSKN